MGVNKLEQAARQALEALMGSGYYDTTQQREAITALREALAEQAEQEPVAWAHPSGGHLSARYMKEFATGLEKETHTIPLYAAPVRTKDLTKTEMLTEAVEAGFMLHTGYGQGANKMMPVSDSATLVEFARAVIAADRELNK